MMFHVGQKVVCVEANFSAGWERFKTPCARSIYTVRALVLCDFAEEASVPCLLLEEVRNVVFPFDDGDTREIPFARFRFRPIVQRKTDISIFTDMLVPSDEKIGASA